MSYYGTMKSCRANFNDLHFHYLHWSGGDGEEPIVLVHGFNQTAYSWEEFGTMLAQKSKRHVYALTQRGHGLTETDAQQRFSREQMVDDIRAFVEGVVRPRGSRIVLLGMSMGAVHCMLYAKRHSEKLSHLVVVDNAPEIMERGKASIVSLAVMRKWTTFEEAVAEVLMLNPQRTRENIEHRLRHSLKETVDGWVWMLDPNFFLHPRWHTPEDPEVMWGVARSIQTPALFVRGEHSNVVSVEAAERMVRDLRASYACIVNAGHSVAGDNPDALCAAVLEFLQAKKARL